MTKRIGYVALAAVILIVAGYLIYSNTASAKDRAAWARFRKQATAENVSKIEFGAGKSMLIADKDRAEVLGLLQKATFDRSNREGNGPTPGAVLSLIFKDGRRVNLGMWSFQTFELQPEPGSQFLIKADDLGVWLRNHFQGPSLG
jgi:hypothetical protein